MYAISDARRELTRLAISMDVLFSMVPHYKNDRSLDITGYTVYIHEGDYTNKMWYFGSLDYMVSFLIELNEEG